MSQKWITDRIPTAEHTHVFNAQGRITLYHHINKIGQPWMPITPPEPYVKPKRYGVRETYSGSGKFAVYDTKDGLTCSIHLPTLEAAERIAAIYEEVMP